ncbi:Long-chain-alcohol oxidase fao4a [Dionaea muscipula]
MEFSAAAAQITTLQSLINSKFDDGDDIDGNGDDEGRILVVADDEMVDQLNLLQQQQQEEEGMKKKGSEWGDQLGGRRSRPLAYVNKLSSREMESLAALCDTFFPSLPPPRDDEESGAGAIRSSDSEYESLVSFFKTSASLAGTPELLGGLISQRLGHHVGLIRLNLWILSTWLGTLMVGGRHSLSPHFPYFNNFSRLSLSQRQRILLSWSFSWFPHLRMGFTGFKLLICLTFFTQLDEKGNNPSWKAIGYSGPDPEFMAEKKARLSNRFSYLMSKDDQTQGAEEEQDEEQLNGPLYRGLININGRPREVIAESLRERGFNVAVRHKKSSSSLSSPSLIIQCDAVVIGSGSGGGVVAGVLAKAGFQVLVLEKGGYCARSNLSLLEGQTLDQMYEGAGLLSTQDVGVTILAGSTVGGGSTVNWSASIRTPEHVIREWSQSYELELFDSKLYKDALDVVCERMQVQPDVEDEGFNNAVLRKGCEELGYPVQNIPRNAPADHYCGWCSLGCKDGRKKGTSETWLKDLVDSGNGAIIPSCEATRVLHERKKGRTRSRATGVAFQFSYKGAKEICVVESKVTVVACGALNTPVLLRKSGLKNKNIGKHLHLHPVTMAWGYFPETTGPSIVHNKKSYEGGIMTAMSTVVANYNTSGYGAILQTPSLHPGLFSSLMPWTSGTDIKLRMSRFSRIAHIIALARDKGSGKISSKSSQKVSYQMATTDETNLKKGIEKMLRILAAAGAEEIGTHHLKGEKINVKRVSSHEFERFVKRESSRQLRGLLSPIASAHQMGSCRMGVDPTISAVNPMGETWEVEGLFVADSSVFPTALGVNPMVTIQAISYCTALSVLQVLHRKRAANTTRINGQGLTC